MSGWLVGLSLRQPLLVVAFTLALIGGGWAAWRGLPIDAFPDVSSTQVKVIIKAPGMTPEEIEQPSPTSPSTSTTAPMCTGHASRWPSGWVA